MKLQQCSCILISITFQVVEAAYENMEIKKKIFTKLDQICKPSAILCSNTSTLDIDEVGGALPINFS